jgi:hypothetical protein
MGPGFGESAYFGSLAEIALSDGMRAISGFDCKSLPG